MPAREFDLVLFGATGFTGRLVAEYLAGRHAPGLRWALAGRSEAKLKDVRAALARIDAGLADLPLLVADAADAAALGAVAGRTRVVCTTVGPYGRYGATLVAACAEAGTDYCDLTGEVHFIRATIDAHQDRAAATGARIVHCCGFDSIPSDLGVLALHDHVTHAGKKLARAHLVVLAMRGGMSGGTAGSMLDLAAGTRHDRALRSLLADPYALSPDRTRDRGPDGRDVNRVAFDQDAGVWTAPFVMAAINTRVVRRSNVLLDWAYGRDFRYDEVMGTGRGPQGLVAASAFTAGLGTLLALAASDVTRPLLARALPKPGEGPTEARRTRGFFKIAIYGTVEGDTSPRYISRVTGKGDPGYGATARMLTESALHLVATAEGERRGGVHTPASALGLQVIDRLRAADIGFEVAAL